ncbi:MAG: hypothetical protein ACP5G2_07170 [Candidatus Bipolaricaulaceae bacterium]
MGLVGGLGFTVAGATMAGYGLGYGVDLLAGGKVGRVVGLVFGLASGLWTAGKTLSRLLHQKRGEDDT